jgi:hypothetical protein
MGKVPWRVTAACICSIRLENSISSTPVERNWIFRSANGWESGEAVKLLLMDFLLQSGAIINLADVNMEFAKKVLP